MFREPRDDLGHQALEGLVPAVFARVELAVAVDDPAVIAGARLAQCIGPRPCPALEERLDRAHRIDETILLARGKQCDRPADFL